MAGEIQLNSTTMATESSGSITAELDLIRPNTTNGSLTLQGDSSGSGVSGITIDSSGNATFAQTITGGTIGSGVVFPAGGTGNPISIAILAEQFAYNVDKASSAGINLREINTEVSDTDGIVTISGSPNYTFTITNAGLYLIEWTVVAYDSDQFYSFLTDSSDVKITDSFSVSNYLASSFNVSGITNAYAIQNLTSSKEFKLKVYLQTSSSIGNGIAHDVSGDPNNYSIVKITKLK